MSWRAQLAYISVINGCRSKIDPLYATAAETSDCEATCFASSQAYRVSTGGVNVSRN